MNCQLLGVNLEEEIWRQETDTTIVPFIAHINYRAMPTYSLDNIKLKMFSTEIQYLLKLLTGSSLMIALLCDRGNLQSFIKNPVP